MGLDVKHKTERFSPWNVDFFGQYRHLYVRQRDFLHAVGHLEGARFEHGYFDEEQGKPDGEDAGHNQFPQVRVPVALITRAVGRATGISRTTCRAQTTVVGKAQLRIARFSTIFVKLWVTVCELEPMACAILVKGILEHLNQGIRAVSLVNQENLSILKKRTALWNKSAVLLRQFNLRDLMALND